MLDVEDFMVIVITFDFKRYYSHQSVLYIRIGVTTSLMDIDL